MAALGAPAIAVLIFEVLLNATSMFNHSNIRLPAVSNARCDGWWSHPRCIGCITRSIMRETNSNFGFNLPWWDRLLGTYRPQPAAGHDGMTLGVKEFRDPAGLRLDRMLLQPLRRGDPDLARFLNSGRGFG